MTSRLDAPDTPADLAIRAVADRDPLTGFTVTAGAGSGKTTSLVKALDHIASSRASSLRANGQKVACITYTVVAANEIHEEIGRHPLASVATIHSFLWSVIEPFQHDIGTWVRHRAQTKLEELLANPRSTDKYFKEVAKYRLRIEASQTVTRWDYGFGTDYRRGHLGHAEVIAMVPELVMANDLLARLLARRFPFILIDESQDAAPKVVQCLLRAFTVADGRMCLGFFGDPMQQIYPGGIKDIVVPEGWVSIEKPENFRSSRRVLDCVNAVRASGGDPLRQTSGLADQPDGEALCFVLCADDQRTAMLEQVRRWLDTHSTTGPWTGDGAKVLVLEHRMAADRLGFSGLDAAFRMRGKSSLKAAFDDGQAWPLAPVRDFIAPLCSADTVRSPAILALFREHSPLLSDARTAADVRSALAAIGPAVNELRELAHGPPEATMGELLRFVIDRRLIAVDPRLAGHLDTTEITDETSPILAAMEACTLSELPGYKAYVAERSPYATHQGTKGAEFDRVLLVIDADSRHRQFSYDKWFGLEELSITDNENRAAGRDSVIERTQRLLYVGISRARTSVAIVLYAADTAVAAAAVSASALGTHVRTITEAEVTAAAPAQPPT